MLCTRLWRRNYSLRRDPVNEATGAAVSLGTGDHRAAERHVHYSPAWSSCRERDRTITGRQHARLVSQWIGAIGLDPSIFGTHSLRRTKATLIYRRTGNLRAIQLLLGHKKIESTARYLGIEVDEQNSSALP
jgi:integrase